MDSTTGLKAGIAFFAWIGVALVLGFVARGAIANLLGPGVWLGVALWAGAIVGLVNVLVILILSRR
jgi:hypothetical protein